MSWQKQKKEGAEEGGKEEGKKGGKEGKEEGKKEKKKKGEEMEEGRRGRKANEDESRKHYVFFYLSSLFPLPLLALLLLLTFSLASARIIMITKLRRGKNHSGGEQAS